jgi:hypothetical protein
LGIFFQRLHPSAEGWPAAAISTIVGRGDASLVAMIRHPQDLQRAKSTPVLTEEL